MWLWLQIAIQGAHDLILLASVEQRDTRGTTLLTYIPKSRTGLSGFSTIVAGLLSIAMVSSPAFAAAGLISSGPAL